MKKILFILAMMLMAIGAQAQMKIVTGHPDLNIKILRCVAADKTVVIDMIISNNGSQDIDLDICGGAENGITKAYDDDSNVYEGQGAKAIRVSLGNKSLTVGWCYGCPIPSETSVKARMQIEGVSYSATEFIRINMDARCYELDIKPIKFYHIPITRE